MQNEPERVVLDRDDLRRTLVRIAHEIVEKNPGSEGLALVGIHTRGAVIARRLHALVGELTGSEVPLGDLDISFYRDDLYGREPGAQPVVHSSHLDFELGGRTIVSLFYESSTRTSSSFELAAKRLSADVISVKSSGSSVDKGESLKDTIATLSAYAPEAIVIRHPHAGAAKLITAWTEAAVVNAGDGKHEHPSQALLDTYTLLDRFSELEGRRREGLEGKRIWIVGDVLHSRVARSCALCFRKMGAEVTVCGPPTLIPRGIAEALGVEVTYSLDGLAGADVVYALRMQRERMTDTFVPSIREYAVNYQIDSRRLGSRQLLMHPGPVNRGVELSPEVIDGPASLITAQVESGLVVRRAVLYELLAGGGEPRPVATAEGSELPAPTPIGEPA
jgi:aspartate carbamoyltransferase catalytic subunit